METFDQQNTRQIWNRVYEAETRTPNLPSLIPLIAQEESCAVCCIRLAKRLGGRGGPLLRIARQCRQNSGCLRGISTVINGSLPPIAVPPPRDKPYRAALQECYVNSLAGLNQYEAYSTDPDFGPVFRKMASSTRDRCAILLELIGKVGS